MLYNKKRKGCLTCMKFRIWITLKDGKLVCPVCNPFSSCSSDNYFTPFYAWKNIEKYIPKNKKIWEPFYNDSSRSPYYLQKLGCDVVYNKEDFFENNRGDIVVSNPPFSIKKEVLERLIELNKPFILIMPSSVLHTQYFKHLFKDDPNMQIIIPKQRIHFMKMVNGSLIQTNGCNFDCSYYCWKINMKKQITFL